MKVSTHLDITEVNNIAKYHSYSVCQKERHNAQIPKKFCQANTDKWLESLAWMCL